MARSKSIPKKTQTENDENESLSTTETSSQKQTETQKENTEQEPVTPVGDGSPDVQVDGEDGEKADTETDEETPEESDEEKAVHEPLINKAPLPVLVNGETEKENEKRLAPFRHPRVSLPVGRILTPEMPDSVTGEEVQGGVLVDVDTYRVHIPFNAKRPVVTILFRKGMIVPATSLQKIG